MMWRALCACLGLILTARCQAAVDYDREVKPLLRAKCFACHGVLQQKAELRLDSIGSMHRGGESGTVIRAGKPDESLLLQAVTGSAGFRMPPDGDGKPLSEAEIALLTRWIAEGAQAPADDQPDQDPRTHWSYQPIRRPELPATHRHDWCRQPLDRFIAAAHETHGLTPVPEASRDTWLRRVTLDLTGLPPTREELLRFRQDTSESAFETVVDDLLARPAYGERWGRHWMDIWRYSDWYGSRGINEIRYSQRHIWRWRDWIIQSLNEDRGYDRMILEMLAGDELNSGDPATLAATGYLGRNWYKFDRDVWMFETVERTAEAFLGLTLRCCRCHDHKYDPVSQRDYYRFRAFFEPHDVRTDPLSALVGTEKDSTLGMVPRDGLALVYDKQPDAPTWLLTRGDNRYPDQSEKLLPGVPESLGGDPIRITPVTLNAEIFYPALRAEMRDSLLTSANQTVAAAEAKRLSEQQKLDDLDGQLQKRKSERDADKSAANMKSGSAFLRDDFSVARPDVWKTLNGQWAYENKHLVQKADTSFATIHTLKDHPPSFHLKLKYRTLATGKYRSVGFSFDFVDTGNSQDVYTSTGDDSQSVQAFHRLNGQQHYPQAGIVKTPLRVGDVTQLDVTVSGSTLTIVLNGEKKLEYVMPVPRRTGRLALWVHNGAAEFLELDVRELQPTVEHLEQQLADARLTVRLAEWQVETARADQQAMSARLAADRARYLKEFPSSGPSDWSELAKVASTAERTAAALRLKEDILRLSHQLDRSDLPSTGPESKAIDDLRARLAEAQRKYDDAVSAARTPGTEYTPLGDVFPETSTGRRLALARWIASPANPRTARVAANHIWGRHFGRSLVETTENFGLNGVVPSHPELLDWLASELIANEWRMKPLHRAIVLSSVYRMQSSCTEASDVQCRENAHRDSRNRFLWRMNPRRLEAETVRDSILALSGTLDSTPGGPEIPENQGEAVPRRSVYFRSTPNEKMPLLEVFDVADPNACYRRKESVVPQQALALMNSGLTQDKARGIAARLTQTIPLPQSADLQESPGTLTEFVIAAFETVLCRPPTAAELEACLSFLTAPPSGTPPGDRAAFSAGGSSSKAPASDPRQRVRENLIHVLLLHNDFVTIR